MKPSPLPRPCLDYPIEQTDKGSAPASPQNRAGARRGFEQIGAPISRVMAQLAEKMNDA
jgi:hypothetical protein